MASIQSLGLHEPGGLSYLIAESILPHDPLPSSYRWRYQTRTENDKTLIDEVLSAGSHVVWTRNGTIKRAFNLGIEGEPLLHAFITQFDNLLEPAAVALSPNATEHESESALVVVLRTQVHIFPASGDIHVLPLAFDVEHAFPCARGFILQRQVLANNGVPDLPQDSPQFVPPEPVLKVKKRNEHDKVDTKLKDGPKSGQRINIPNVPYTYSFTELLSELGMVVSGLTRRSTDLDDCHMLSANEKIIYISSSDELKTPRNAKRDPLHICITVNEVSSSLTAWQVVFSKSSPDVTNDDDRPKSKKTTRRKSSNVYARQAGIATPVSRGPGTFRESFGGRPQTLTESSLFQLSREQAPRGNDDLVAQLGQEFEHGPIQTRSARRVSSMLARTDLGGPNDRSTFNDLPLGPTGRKSLGRSIKRGESTGGFSDRQSFGRRRSSFQANNSVWSDGTSFLDIPASHLLDDGLGLHGGDLLDQDFSDSLSRELPRQVGLMKLRSISFTVPSSTGHLHDLLQVSTVIAPDRSTADERRSKILSVCIMNRSIKEMTTINLAVKPQWSTTASVSSNLGNDVKAVEIHRGHGIVDACKVVDGSVARLLTLTHTRDGQSILHLEAPWAASFRLDLPEQYRVFDKWNPRHSKTLFRRQDAGIRRVISGSHVDLTTFGHVGGHDRVLLIDKEQRQHSFHVQLLPSTALIRKILDVVNFVLPPEQTDSLLMAWWEVKRWLENQALDSDLEWTAITISLFLLAVPFLEKVTESSPSTPRRKKGGVLRSSSGVSSDTEQWDRMRQIMGTEQMQLWPKDASWSWLKSLSGSETLESKVTLKHKRTISAATEIAQKKDAFLPRCAKLAKDFLQSPTGETAIGPEGYLPIAVNKDLNHRRTALASIVVGLHLLLEEQKLDTLTPSWNENSSNNLALVVTQLASWFGWEDWRPVLGTYYGSEIPDLHRWQWDNSVIGTQEVPIQPFEPPSIYQYIESTIRTGSEEVFPSLLDRVSQSRHMSTNHPLYKAATRLTPRLFAVTAFLRCINGKVTPQQTTENMLSSGINEEMLRSIPEAIAAAIHQAITVIRANPPPVWSETAYRLIGRDDLGGKLRPNDVKRGLSVIHPHESSRDYRTLGNLAIEAENLSRWDASSEIDRQTVTKLIFRDDRRFQEASKLVNQTRPPVVECTIEPGWSEGDLLEAQKELAQHVSRRTFSVSAGRGIMHFNARVPLLTERVPVPAFTPQCIIKPRGANDTTQPMTFSADKALFTEEKTCWAFFHNGASAGLMISRDARWIDTSWILYNKPSELTNRHAGFLLALGLNGHLESLAKWVAFKYLTPKHTMTSVGLLLGLSASYLGTADMLITRLLSVHVTRLLPVGAAELNLSPLTQTAGLMGIGLLYHNSQHRRMSEVMLSEIENSDAEERAGDEPILRDEGYRLAAGLSLGLINLGQGDKLHSLHDMSVIERLLSIAIGTKNVNLVHVLDRATAGAVIAVALIFLKTNNKSIASKIDIPDTLQQFEYVRPDVFLLRTLARHLIMWDSIVPSQSYIRDSLPAIYQKRVGLSTTKRLSTDDLPLFNIVAGICFAISLRYAGSHHPKVRDLLLAYLDQFWRLSKLPALNYDSRVTLNSVRNCLDVLALSCATVMSGSGDLMVMRRLRALHGRTDPDTPFGSHLAAHMALGALFLSGGTATFGTSNLAIASLIIAFYPVFPTDMLDNRGHLQALRHFWVLAVDDRCLVGRDVETGIVVSGIEAELTLTDGSHLRIRTPGLLPDLDMINHIKLRHEAYWPVGLDLTSPSREQANSGSSNEGKPQSTRRTAKQSKISNPTLRDDLKMNPKNLAIPLLRRAAHEKASASSSTFATELQALDEARGIPSVDANNTTVNERWKHVHVLAGTDGHARNPFEWVFQLDSLKGLDHAEKALILDGGRNINQGTATTDQTSTDPSTRKFLATTVVDTRLEFEVGTLGLEMDILDQTGGQKESSSSSSSSNINTNTTRRSKTSVQNSKSSSPSQPPVFSKDKLWQLRLLFAWADKWDREEQDRGPEEWDTMQMTTAPDKNEIMRMETKTRRDPRWLRREVIERLRWRVWNMAGGGEADGEGC